MDKYTREGSSVLDYGCGLGYFLRAAKDRGYRVSGVEFDGGAASAAAQVAQCEVFSIKEFMTCNSTKFDVIHLGDVLEHLPDPASTLKWLLDHHLKSGGILFVEGPLEANPSPVYWTAYLFARIKRLLRPALIGEGSPMHLFRTASYQQLQFFYLVDRKLTKLHWDVHETGWPYLHAGFIKSAVAKLSTLIGGRRLGSTVFGNRFIGVFRYSDN